MARYSQIMTNPNRAQPRPAAPQQAPSAGWMAQHGPQSANPHPNAPGIGMPGQYMQPNAPSGGGLSQQFLHPQVGQMPQLPAGVQPLSNGPQGITNGSGGGYQRVGTGQYRGPNGQIVNSAQNPMRNTAIAQPQQPAGLGTAALGNQPSFNNGSFLGQSGANPLPGNAANQFNPGSAYGQPGQQPAQGYGTAPQQDPTQVGQIFGTLANQNLAANAQMAGANSQMNSAGQAIQQAQLPAGQNQGQSNMTGQPQS